MTATSLTASIGNVIYPVRNTSYGLSDKVDARSTCRLTIYDANGTYSFQFGQPVIITDLLEGVKFTGFVHKPIATKYAAQPAMQYTIDCVDNHLIADTITSNDSYSNQYTGIIAASQANKYLSAKGVTANYAIREDHAQGDFAQGTLSNTAATANNSGDLELAPAGSNVTISGAGAGFTLVNGLKFTGYCSSGYSSAYVFRQIWNGSITIAASDNISYDIWISSDSPEIKASVDFICSDGTAYRDSTSTDGMGMSVNPTTDLSGLANDQWYTRVCGFQGSYTGKTIKGIQVAIGGVKQGTYTVYFRRIVYNINAGGSTTIFSDASTLNANVQILNNGYTNVSLMPVSVEDKTHVSVRGPFSIDAAKIVQSSQLTYSSLIPSGCTGLAETSIDNQASWQAHTSGNAVPNLLAGMSVAGRSIYIRWTFSTGKDPTVNMGYGAPTLVVNSAYNATKSDVITTYTTATDFSSGTLTDVKTVGSTSTPAITTNGFQWNWDSTFPSQTVYGSGSTSLINKQQYLNVNASSIIRLRMDFAGTWADSIIECDVFISTNYESGLFYRTTAFGTNDNFAYGVEVLPTAITLYKGTNTTSSVSFTQLTTASLSLVNNSVHRLKIVAVGSSHTIYLDGVALLTATDSTFTAAGYVGFRVRNNTGSPQSAAFDNFGVCSALSGTWQSPSIDISGATTYGNSVVQWDIDGLPDSTTSITAQTSIDAGSTWQSVTNGGAISGLTAGTSLSGKHLLIKMTLTASNAPIVPVLNGVSVWVIGQYSSSGTRIAPLVSLAPALVAGATAVTWTTTTPTNTTLTVATSLDGTTYTNVANGGSIAGITAQPTATLDTFDTNSGPNYTSTNRTGGSVGSWIQDTLNSRMTVSGGTNAQLLYAAISCKDADILLDLDQADCVGLVWRVQDASNFYELDIFDASSNAGSTNAVKLYKIVANVKTQLGSTATPALTRGTKYRIRAVMIGTAITIYVDGVSIMSLADSALAGPGQIGISEVSGIGRFYNFRVQPQGDNLAGKVVYSRITLTSTDPTATPQLTDLVVAALNPSIGLGTLVPQVDYIKTYLSSNFDDLVKKSNTYYWLIDQYLNFVFNDRVATPAPWILQSSDQQLLLQGPLSVEYSGDLYRNRHSVTGVLDSQGGTTGVVSVDNTNLAGTITQRQFARVMCRATAVLIVLNQASAAQTVSGDFGDLIVSTCSQIAIDINITAITGTSPTIQFFIDRKDANGLYFNLWSSSVVSATGSVSTSIGPLALVQQSLGATVKLRYVITGTTPSVTFSASVLGRLTVQSAGLGIIEVVEDVSSQGLTTAAATAYCLAQLQRYGTTGRTVKFKTYRSNPSLAIGEYLPVFIPEHAVNDAPMLITQIDTTQKISADPGGSGNMTQIYYQTITVSENAVTGSVWKLIASTIS